MGRTDNKTPHNSAEYDGKVRDIIPYYDCFHSETINIVKAACPNPPLWLDTGCGTGTLVKKAAESFPETHFTLTDPSGGMLELAREKLAQYGERTRFLAPKDTQSLTKGEVGRPYVVTAIQAHHYGSQPERGKATKRCYELLGRGGIYVTFENIRPMTEGGLDIGMMDWTRFQLDRGRDRASVDSHMRRFDAEYFPITIEEHIKLLRKTGFKTVEVLWASYMQAGFYGIK